MNISVKKLALLAIASVFSAGLWAQKKELTLDEVFLSPGKFKPEAYSGVQWSPSGAQWAHYDAETEELALETPKGYTSRVTASDLEKSLGKNVSSVPSAYSWKDYDNIYFEFPSYVVKYTLSAKKAEIVLSWDESIKGVHVSPVKDAVAYSKDGNVYYSKGGNTVRVSSDGGNGIVNGQSVHRNEFGIDRGIFFSPDGKKLAYYRKNESMVMPYPIVNTSSRIAMVEEIPYPMAGEKSEEVELCIYDVQTGSSIRLEKRGAAEDYLTAVTWDPSGKYVYVAETHGFQQIRRIYRFFRKDSLFRKQRQMGGTRTTGTVFQIAPRGIFLAQRTRRQRALLPLFHRRHTAGKSDRRRRADHVGDRSCRRYFLLHGHS